MRMKQDEGMSMVSQHEVKWFKLRQSGSHDASLKNLTIQKILKQKYQPASICYELKI